MSPVRPKSIGTCSLGDLLGKGGMAEVFRGVQEPLDRQVAIKALLPEFKEDEVVNERFRREALALAHLQHENIVAVYDLLEKYSRLYLIMEFVDGVDLASVLEKGPVPIDISLMIGSCVASALEHAHFRRVIHRDVKPGNVMLSRSGQVKLTDFGIAKDQTLDDLTRQGFVVGTVNYLSPEQLGGGKADWRSDIYSLGVTLFEALTGQRAHAGESHPELLSAILNGRHRRLRKSVPQLPRSVEKIVHRCLDADPGKRYQRAAELRRALDRLLAAVIRGTPSARLVGFLKERELLQGEDLTMIDSTELAASLPVSAPETVLGNRLLEREPEDPPRGGSWRVALTIAIVLLLVAGGAVATYLLAPEWSREVLEQVAAWMATGKSDVEGLISTGK